MKKLVALFLLIGCSCSQARIRGRVKKVEPKKADQQKEDELSKYPPEVRKIMERPEMKGMRVISVEEDVRTQPVRLK